jgi:GT2 family glycosyltransferase
MRLGVGVTCYNDFDLTAACVSSVLRNGAGVNEVCVVDDGSR